MTTSITLTTRLISGNLFAYWSEQGPEGLQTEFPGTVLVTDDLEEWAEIQVTAWQAKRQRVNSRGALQVRVLVHVFVRQGTNEGRLQEVAELVRGALENRLIALREGDEENDEVQGYLRLREGEIRDLSPREREADGSGLRHAVVLFSGRAESA
ncbi:MAG: hypothetical protein U0903_18080 [Planctomycetales bacterium]